MDLCTALSHSYSKASICSIKIIICKSSSGRTYMSYQSFTLSISKTQFVISSPKPTIFPAIVHGSTGPSTAQVRNLLLSHPPPSHEVLSTLSPKYFMNLSLHFTYTGSTVIEATNIFP